MSGPIKLTDDERFAAADYLEVASGFSAGWALAQIDQIVLAVNRSRAGDPVGTVRRNPKNGVVAIRQVLACTLDHLDCRNRNAQLAWHWIDETGTQRHTGGDDCISAYEIAKWPVIYPPEATS